MNLRGGGTAGMIVVVPKESATTPGTRDPGEQLVAMGDSFAKETGTEVSIGGTGGAFGDFTSEGPRRSAS